MSLCEVKEVHRCDSEMEAEQLIAAAKDDRNFLLKSYNSDYKEVKVKGEVEETYFKVTLHKIFDDIKAPIFNTVAEYHLHHAEVDDED